MAATQYTSEASLGYANPDDKPPFLFSSNSYYAWCIGRWLRRTHRSAPRDVRASRGYTFHVNDMKVQLNDIQGCTEVERIA
jgi:hypothetical protein